MSRDPDVPWPSPDEDADDATRDACAVCGDSADDHDAAEFGGGCGVCGDCPGYEATP